MYVADIRASLRRRWHLALLGLLVTAGLVYGALVAVPVKYESAADVVLLPQTATGGNPYLSLGGLDSMVDIVARAMASSSDNGTVSVNGQVATFAVARDTTAPGPILLITVDAPTREATLRGLEKLAAQVPTTLDSLQQAANVPSGAYVQSRVVSADRMAKTVRKSQVRAVAAALVAGLALTLVLVALVDRILLARRRQPRRAAGSRADGEWEDVGPEAARGEPALLDDESIIAAMAQDLQTTPTARRH